MSGILEPFPCLATRPLRRRFEARRAFAI